MFRVRRVYLPPERDGGFRVLVDRLWPRGISKAKARVDLWLKDVAPSDGLRQWYGHDPERWEEFRRRYRDELKGNAEAVRELRALVKEHGTVTLLFAAKDEERNNAVALAEVVGMLRKSGRRVARAP